MAQWMSSQQVKAALQVKRAGEWRIWVLLGFVWFVYATAKIKVLCQNNLIYPVLKWFSEWCTKTGTENIPAGMYFEILQCTHLIKEGFVGTQSRGQCACSTSACQCHQHEHSQFVMSPRGATGAAWSLVWPQRKKAHTHLIWTFCHEVPMQKFLPLQNPHCLVASQLLPFPIDCYCQLSSTILMKNKQLLSRCWAKHINFLFCTGRILPRSGFHTARWLGTVMSCFSFFDNLLFALAGKKIYSSP